MKVLISGAAGFIAGYLIEELLGRGYEIVGLDNFSKYGNRSDPGEYRLVEGDARDAELVAHLLRGCDHFVAAAAMIGGISYFHKYPYDLLAMNERITASSVDAALTSDVDKVTYLSSSMVYENATLFPSEEGDEKWCAPPSSSYGFQKLAVEYFARAAWDQHKLPYTILRPFNCVGIGEGLKESHVVPDLVRKVLQGDNPLHILGSGDQVRHYTYGGDLARGIADSMESPAAFNQDFNLSTSESTTVLELANLIWAKINGDKPLAIVHDAPYPYDVLCRTPDTSKASELLGFKAETSLSDMLELVINHYRDG